MSEFRIESGLNCGGHAFATDGYLMGPILEEFKLKRNELTTTLFEIYNKALDAKSCITFSEPHPIKISAQEELALMRSTNFCAIIIEWIVQVGALRFY